MKAIVLVGLVVGPALLASLLIGVIVGPVTAALSAPSGSGGGSGGGIVFCRTAPTASPSASSTASSTAASTASSTAASSPDATSTATGSTPSPGVKGGTPTPTAASGGTPCVDPSANSIVRWAVAIGRHLYGCPTPSSMDVCYDSNIPPQALDWWRRTCAGCRQWQNGDLQCVMFNAAVFGLAGLPLIFGPHGSNAIDFWTTYAHVSHWGELLSAWGAPPQRSLPAPGDMMVWYDRNAPQVGHIAVVIAVAAPTKTRDGSVVFAEANGPGAFTSASITPDLSIPTWRGYQVVGFIRYLG